MQCLARFIYSCVWGVRMKDPRSYIMQERRYCTLLCDGDESQWQHDLTISCYYSTYSTLVYECLLFFCAVEERLEWVKRVGVCDDVFVSHIHVCSSPFGWTQPLAFLKPRVVLLTCYSRCFDRFVTYPLPMRHDIYFTHSCACASMAWIALPMMRKGYRQDFRKNDRRDVNYQIIRKWRR